MIELKPCPFCGSTVTFGTGTYGECYIYCMNYHYFFSTDEFRFAYGDDDKELVAREWNRRWGE